MLSSRKRLPTPFSSFSCQTVSLPASGRQGSHLAPRDESSRGARGLHWGGRATLARLFHPSSDSTSSASSSSSQRSSSASSSSASSSSSYSSSSSESSSESSSSSSS